MNTEEKCIPHGFTGCCNVVEVPLDASECLNFHEGDCSGEVEYRMPMSGTGKSFPRCDHHFEVRLNTQRRISRDYGVPMFYDGGDW